MKTIRILLGTLFGLAAAGAAPAQDVFGGGAEVLLQFSPSDPSMSDARLEVRVIADLGAVETGGGAGAVLASYSMPVGFDPSYVRLVSAEAGEAPGYSSETFAYTNPAFANGRGLVTVMNRRAGDQDPGTRVELGRLTFEIRRPGNASFIAGSSRTTHPGALAAFPEGAGGTVQRVPWEGGAYEVAIAADAGLPSLLCPSWFSVPEMFQGMALLNEGEDPASIQMFGWGRLGALVETGSAQNPSMPSSLPALHQDARVADQIFNSAGAMNVRDGWIEVRADAPGISGFFLQGVNEGPVTTQMDGIPMTYTPSSRLVFPVFPNPGREAAIALANAGGTEVNADIRVVGPSGERVMHAYIPPHGSVSKTIEEGAGEGGTYVDVQAEGGRLAGVERFGTGQSLAALAGQDAELASTRLYGPQFASGNLGGGLRIDTQIVLVNPSNSATVVILRLLDDQGRELAAPVVRALEGGGLLSSKGWELFGLPDPLTDPSVTSGTVIVESDQGIIGGIAFGDPAEGTYLSSLPLMPSSLARREIYFGQIAVGRLGNIDYFTGLALVNPGTTETARVDIEAHQADGSILARTAAPLEIGPGARAIGLLQALVPGFPESQFGGYIRLISNIEVNAYILIGDNYYNFLSAVP